MGVQTFIILCGVLVLGMVESATKDGQVRPGTGPNSSREGLLIPLGVISRKRRMTCDALSFPLPYGYVNHAACASYCIATWQNVRGYCQHGICKCK